MRPDFALTLSHEAIGLWRRVDAGWEELGSAPLSDQQLDARLADLRDAAARAAGGPFFTKVLIPDSEVLVTTLEGAPLDEADFGAWIGQQIEGLTPYAAADLVFDWERAPDGGLRVAVAARDILAEAEAFAHAHQFNPVSVVGNGRGDAFAGEPYFGATEVARSLLPAEAAVERDAEPVCAAPLPEMAADTAPPVSEAEIAALADPAEPEQMETEQAGSVSTDADLAHAEPAVQDPTDPENTAEPDAGQEASAEEAGFGSMPQLQSAPEPDPAFQPEPGQEPEADAVPAPATAGALAPDTETEAAELVADEAAQAGEAGPEGVPDPAVAVPAAPGADAEAEVAPAEAIRAAIDRAREADAATPQLADLDASIPGQEASDAESAGETSPEVPAVEAEGIPASPQMPEKLAAALEKFQDRPETARPKAAAPAMPAALARAVLTGGKRRPPLAEREAGKVLPPRPVAPLSGATRRGADDPFAGFGKPAPALSDIEAGSLGSEQRARAARAFESIPDLSLQDDQPEPVVEFGPAVFSSRRDPNLARGDQRLAETAPAARIRPVPAVAPQADSEPPAMEELHPSAAAVSAGAVAGSAASVSADTEAGQPVQAAWQRLRSAVSGFAPKLPRKRANGPSLPAAAEETAAEALSPVAEVPQPAPRRVADRPPSEVENGRRGLRGAADLAGMVTALAKRPPRPDPAVDIQAAEVAGPPLADTLPASDRRSAPLPPRQPLAAGSAMSEAEALTIFGARRQRGGRRSGAGSLGIVLFAVLVMVLAAVALWAAFFMRDARGTLTMAEAPSATTVPAESQAAITAPDALLTEETVEAFDPTLLPMPAEAGPDLVADGPFNVDEPAVEPAPPEDPAQPAEAALPEAGPGPGTPAMLPDALPSLGAAPEAAAPGPTPVQADPSAPSAVVPPPAALGAPGPADRAAAAPEAAPPAAAEAPSAVAEAAPALTAEELAAAYPETGIWPFAPEAAPAPVSRRLDDLFFSGVDGAAPPDTIAELPEAGLALRDTMPRPAAPPPPPGSFAAAAPAAGAAPVVADTVASVPVTMSAPPVVPPSRAAVLPPVPVLAAPEPLPNTRPQPRPTGQVPAGFDSGAVVPDPEAETAATEVAVAPAASSGTAPDPALAGAATVAADLVAVALPAQAPVEQPEVVPVVPVVRDASTAALRPELRPQEPGQSSTIQEASLPAASEPGPEAETETATATALPDAEDAPTAPVLMPRPRPSALAAVAAAAAAAAAAPPPDPFADASTLAVATSLRPNRRPAGFAQLAAQRQAAAAPPAASPAASPPPTAPVQVAAAPAAPAPTAQPALPTRASVAEQATQARVVNLRNVNLIGVFGTASDRRALVRLSNGQIVTVRVGDRLDGGQVAAIGDGELRYLRNGRNEVLRVGG